MAAASDKHLAERLRRLTGWAGFGLVTMGVVAGAATFAILTGMTPIVPSRSITTMLLIANGALVLVMALMVIGQLFVLLVERGKGTPGAGLHLRLVLLFSLIAVVPALLVAAFASVTLNRGLDTWFSERTRGIVDGAVNVAESYLHDNAEATRSDAAAIATDLGQQKELFDSDRQAFVGRVARNALLRGLGAVFVFNAKQKQIDSRIVANDNVEFRPPTDDQIAQADKGEVVVLPPGRGGNVVRALVKLPNFDGEYMFIYRAINPSVLDQLDKTREAKDEYDKLMAERLGVQLTFALMYGVVGFIFLLAAIWIGLWYSDRLVAPVVGLLDAARRVSGGQLDARVPEGEGPGDLQTLARTFNQMTGRIKAQRDELMAANETLDTRRRFMEAMLAGVTAGVIGVDPDGRISLVNRSATSLLDQPSDGLLGKMLGDVLPAFQELYMTALSRPSGSAEAQVDMVTREGQRSYVARFTEERTEAAAHGHVLTFDDITELVSAQRNSAWADIARRIAHEIKNPLTPIQLSAERLKRKYGNQIQQDRQVFDQCTDTIIRQVGDIGRMVDEFSSFARMPKAAPEPHELANVVREATVLQRVAASDLDIELDLKDGDVVFPFDRRLITQAVTNLVKNAREAIEGRQQNEPEPRGHILVEAGVNGQRPFIRVTDNGIGLPKENRHRLAEPYMTTREKGTGLGLAIVKRIMEEHGGRLVLEDAPADFAGGLGARVTLLFDAMPAAAPAPIEV